MTYTNPIAYATFFQATATAIECIVEQGQQNLFRTVCEHEETKEKSYNDTYERELNSFQLLLEGVSNPEDAINLGMACEKRKRDFLETELRRRWKHTSYVPFSLTDEKGFTKRWIEYLLQKNSELPSEDQVPTVELPTIRQTLYALAENESYPENELSQFLNSPKEQLRALGSLKKTTKTFLATQLAGLLFSSDSTKTSNIAPIFSLYKVASECLHTYSRLTKVAMEKPKSTNGSLIMLKEGLERQLQHLSSTPPDSKVVEKAKVLFSQLSSFVEFYKLKSVQEFKPLGSFRVRKGTLARGEMKRSSSVTSVPKEQNLKMKSSSSSPEIPELPSPRPQTWPTHVRTTSESLPQRKEIASPRHTGNEMILSHLEELLLLMKPNIEGQVTSERVAGLCDRPAQGIFAASDEEAQVVF